MKQYRVSKAGRVRTAIVLVTLVAIALYAAQKAWGLWRAPQSLSDPYLFGLDLDKFVPAGLLTLIALTAVVVMWFLLVELLTEVQLNENGILFKTPGFRIFYRWDEIEALDVVVGPVEDAPTCLQVATETPATSSQPIADTSDAVATDTVENYLSEADLREDKEARQRVVSARKAQLTLLRSRATRADGTQLKAWQRLLYPQARRPDRLLLYPSLENRTALLAQIEAYLSRV